MTDPPSTPRLVVVTGADGAIGRATARAFRAEGWRVIGVDRAAANVDDREVDHLVVGDLTDDAVIERVAAEVGDGLDALVNNAAVQIDRGLADTTDDDWEQAMATNVTAPFRLIRSLADPLERRRGSIVNVVSVHALATSVNVAAYAVSKAALAGLTRTAALDLAGRGIRCNAVAPGAIMTDMLRAGLARRPHTEGADGNLRELEARTPLGFIASPDQIAPTIIHLADGRRSPYTTGQVVVVDGGATIRLSTE
jgi:NAD(P)-dependent dehydrogenase (short-subunit alcohol dehydrogenase family)